MNRTSDILSRPSAGCQPVRQGNIDRVIGDRIRTEIHSCDLAQFSVGCAQLRIGKDKDGPVDIPQGIGRVGINRVWIERQLVRFDRDSP